MKNWLFTIFIFQTVCCDARVVCKYFVCVEAIQQDFVGGAAGSPSGTAYRFKLIAYKSSKQLKIDAIWIGENYFSAVPYQIRNGNTEFEKGDTLMLSIKSYLPNNINLIDSIKTETKKLSVPKNYKGAALIGFSTRKKRKYLTVEKIKEISRENRE